ncbi:funZ protein [Sulfitobacter sp. M220]|uniref:P-loop ATPase, Sll1717 family n=1 Tax=Sulfitobacter sp. M220 TaxID=2675333 RepID=UPI001F24931C|nr:hypothetical protein [Sulfitobacter sp. M220]MCF7779323.1 funZ protein [Sulfitobacter sp. M220]
MKKIYDVNFGFSDAENYKRRENKQLFQRFFVKNDFLDDLLRPQTTFLIGEKGTGKTAYSTFLANGQYKDTDASLKFIRETEFSKFVELKKTHNLSLSDYTEIWKTLLLLLFCETVYQKIDKNFWGGRKIIARNIKSAIDEFYNNAFSPEIMAALKFVENSDVAVKILSKYAEVGGSASDTTELNGHVFQTNLLYIRRRLEEVMSAAKLDQDLLIFIDGIDIRPAGIEFQDYLSCIKGLANAVWSLNNDFFPEIKDSIGRFRTVLLVRPDIFLKLGLQNPNTKLRDNSVVLDWSTTYKDYRNSGIFEVVDNLLSVQQEEDLSLGDAWDNYFPFYAPNRGGGHGNDNSFIYFLRNSYYRPRDILTYISIFKKHIPKSQKKELTEFNDNYCSDRKISNEYADYLLGELRDQLVFYYSEEEYEDFIQFFDFLKGKTRFEYYEYVDAHEKFLNDLSGRNRNVPNFIENADGFLQFLYELNVICYIEELEEGGKFIHWSFRERSLGKMAPKIKTDCRYEVHYGLVPALNIGQKRK